MSGVWEAVRLAGRSVKGADFGSCVQEKITTEKRKGNAESVFGGG